MHHLFSIFPKKWKKKGPCKSVYISTHSFFAPKAKTKIFFFFRFLMVCSYIDKQMTEFWFLIGLIERVGHYFCSKNYFLINNFFTFSTNHTFRCLFWIRKLIIENWSWNFNFKISFWVSHSNRITQVPDILERFYTHFKSMRLLQNHLYITLDTRS